MPRSAAADCSAPDELNFGACIQQSTTICASTTPDCALNKEIQVATTSQIVSISLTKCCRQTRTKHQRTCLQLRAAQVKKAIRVLPRGFTDISNVLKYTRNEFRELLKEPDVCSTVSIG
jgi:hypothetical protein